MRSHEFLSSGSFGRYLALSHAQSCSYLGKKVGPFVVVLPPFPIFLSREVLLAARVIVGGCHFVVFFLVFWRETRPRGKGGKRESFYLHELILFLLGAVVSGLIVPLALKHFTIPRTHFTGGF